MLDEVGISAVTKEDCEGEGISSITAAVLVGWLPHWMQQ